MTYRFPNVMRTLAGITAGLFVLTSALTAQPPDKPTKPATPATPTSSEPGLTPEELKAKQEENKKNFSQFKEALFRLATRLEKSDRTEIKEQAVIIRKALDEAEKKGVDGQFASLVAGIARSTSSIDFGKLEDADKQLVDTLNAIMAMLEIESDSARLKAEREKLEAILKELKALTDQQKSTQARTESMKGDPNKLKNEQDRLKDATKDLADRMSGKKDDGKTGQGGGKKDDRAEGKGEPKGGDKAGEGKGDTAEAKGAGKESNGEGKDGKEGAGEGKGEGKGKDGKEGEGKGSGDGKDGKEGAGEGKGSGDGKGKDGKEGMGDGQGKPSDKEGSGQGKPGDGNKPGDGGAKKPGDGQGKPGDGQGKPGDGQGQGEGKGQGKPSDGGAKPGEGGGKPGDGKGQGEGKGGGKGSEGKGQGGEGKGSGKEGGQPPQQGGGQGGSKSGGQGGGGQPSGQPGGEGSQPPKNDTPGRKEIQEAVPNQGDASKKIEDDKRQEAGKSQDKAIEKMEAAMRELEKRLKQLREEEIKKLLANVEARCQKMLAMQIDVYENTKQIDASRIKNGGEMTNVERQKSGTQSDKEGEIVAEADRCLKLLESEGSAVAFAKVLEEVRQDMIAVQRRLNSSVVDKDTQAIEENIIAMLKEMVEALKKQQQQMNQPPKPPGEGGQQKPPNQKLINLIAELKLIRSLQSQVNMRTKMYGDKEKAEQSKDANVQLELRQLAARQQKLQEMIDKIASGENEK